jgi:phosphoribosylamine--glycine ligase
VLKADGLAGGKGVLICENKAEAVQGIKDIMVEQRFGEAGQKVVVEEFLRGEEASIHAITDGKALVVLPTSQDHKRIGDGDQGLNTGGMGAYSPAPVVTPALLEKIERQILIPTLHALRLENIEFRGTLYAGLMITKGGPRLLEYNVRFGDPETQVILPRLKTDLAVLLRAAADGTLSDVEGIEFDDRTAVGVVMASQGYPERYQTGKAISGLDQAGRMDDVQVYHAGTIERSGQMLTAGGRVLCVTALGPDVPAARKQAYAAVDRISWDGAYYRKDIAHRAL